MAAPVISYYITRPQKLVIVKHMSQKYYHVGVGEKWIVGGFQSAENLQELFLVE